MFLNTGLRASELSNIDIGDINFEEKYIWVIGKGNKKRKVYFNKTTHDMILNYLKTQNRTPEENFNEPLFWGNHKERLKVRAIQYICKNAFKLIGLDTPGYSCHTLRHTFATIMYNSQNKDILLVQKMLGHSTISSTEIYAHVENFAVKNAIESNPLANFEVDEQVA